MVNDSVVDGRLERTLEMDGRKELPLENIPSHKLFVQQFLLTLEISYTSKEKENLWEND